MLSVCGAGLRSDLEVTAAAHKESLVYGPGKHNHKHTQTVTQYHDPFYRRDEFTATMSKLQHSETWVLQIAILIWLTLTRTHTRSQFCRGYWQLKQSRVSANNTFRMNDRGQMLQRGSWLNSAVCNVAPVTAVTFTHRHTYFYRLFTGSLSVHLAVTCCNKNITDTHEVMLICYQWMWPWQHFETSSKPSHLVFLATSAAWITEWWFQVAD